VGIIIRNQDHFVPPHQKKRSLNEDQACSNLCLSDCYLICLSTGGWLLASLKETNPVYRKLTNRVERWWIYGGCSVRPNTSDQEGGSVTKDSEDSHGQSCPSWQSPKVSISLLLLREDSLALADRSRKHEVRMKHRVPPEMA